MGDQSMNVASFQISQLMRNAAQLGVSPAIALGVTKSDGMTQTWYEGQQRHDTGSSRVMIGHDSIWRRSPNRLQPAALKLIGEGSVDWETEIGELLPVTSDESRCPLALVDHTAGLLHIADTEGLGASIFISVTLTVYDA